MIRLNQRFQTFFLALLIFLSFGASPAIGQNPKEQQASSISAQELEDLLGILESPTKREAFTKNLKGLLEAKQALEGKDKATAEQGEQLAIIRFIFEQFDQITDDLQKETIALGLILEEMPQAFDSAKTFFLTTQNRPRLRILLLDTAVALLVALLISLLLRRAVGTTMAKMKGLMSKIGWGFVYILLKALPFAALFIIFDIMFRNFPSFPRGRTLVLLLFVLLFLYQVAMAVFHVLLSPDASHARLTPLSDEDANYLWIWIRRFALYAFFYFLITRAFTWTQQTQVYFSYLRGLLLIPFPLMLTVFIFQLAREIHLRMSAFEETPQAPVQIDAVDQADRKKYRLRSGLIRYLPLVAAAYAWAIFFSLIFKYEKGFSYLFRATVGTAMATFLFFILFRILEVLFTRFFRVKERTRRRFPGMEEKANRYLLMVKKGLKIALIVVGTGAVAQIWGIPVSSFVSSDTGANIILRAIAIILTVAVVVSVIEVNNAVATHLVKEKRGGKKREVSQKQKTMVPVLQTAINIAAGFVGGIVVLERLGVNTTPILAGAGIVGLAVGFGSQTLVKDLISGMFILFEESIRVGDWAMVGNQGGSVESVGLRTVKLRDMNGTLHVISNSTIDSLSNFSKVFSRTVMDIGIAYREDVDEVIHLLEELGAELQKDPEYGPNILEPLEIFGLDRFEDSAVIIRARFKTKPLKQWGIKREFYRRMKRAFDEKGIEIPFPHRTVYMGEPKQGSAPPLHVQMDSDAAAPQNTNGGLSS